MKRSHWVLLEGIPKYDELFGTHAFHLLKSSLLNQNYMSLQELRDHVLGNFDCGNENGAHFPVGHRKHKYIHNLK